MDGDPEPNGDPVYEVKGCIMPAVTVLGAALGALFSGFFLGRHFVVLGAIAGAVLLFLAIWLFLHWVEKLK